MKRILLILVFGLFLISFASAQFSVLDVNITYGNNLSTSDTSDGVVFRVASSNLFLFKVNKHPTSTAQKCDVYNNATGVLLTSQNFVGNTCITNLTLSSGTAYRISANATGTRRYTFEPPFNPTYAFGNFTGGCFGGGCSNPAGTQYNIQNITVSNQTAPIDLVLNPQISYGLNNFNFTSNISSPTNTLKNATLQVWFNNGTIFNMTNITISGNTNNTSFSLYNVSLGQYKWNVLGCNINNTCANAPTNLTFSSGLFTEEFSYMLLEGQNAGINLSITFTGIDNSLLALLNWNNTISVPSKNIINSTTIKFVSNFVVPVGTGNSSGVNITHFWRFYLPDGSLNDTTPNQIQNVFSLGFDNCATFSNLLFNYTLYDEDTTLLINGTTLNGTIEVDLDAISLADTSQVTNFSRTYNQTNNARVCISSIASGFRIDSQVRYTANGYVVEFHNIQNASLSASNFPQHIRLFPLLASRSQEFLVTFKDTNFAPVRDALITITRKYVGEGLFRSVESPLTNADGQALTHMVLGDVIYTIVVSKNGKNLGTFDNIVPFCNNVATGDCTINLNAFTTGTSPTNFNTFRNLSYNIEFNKTARTITSIFLTLDGSVSTINLTGTLFDNRGNTTACSTALTTSSGTIICTIPASIGNSTIRAVLYKDGAFVTSGLFSLTDDEETGFGSTGLLIGAILFITIPLMMISSGAGIVVGSILGLIFIGLLNLYTGGGIIGVGSALIWFIIAGVIILWKINDRRGS